MISSTSTPEHFVAQGRRVVATNDRAERAFSTLASMGLGGVTWWRGQVEHAGTDGIILSEESQARNAAATLNSRYKMFLEMLSR